MNQVLSALQALNLSSLLLSRKPNKPEFVTYRTEEMWKPLDFACRQREIFKKEKISSRACEPIQRVNTDKGWPEPFLDVRTFYFVSGFLRDVNE
jgi:hypothetical protein